MKLRATRRSRRGATIVETAIILALLFFFLIGIMEYGRFVMVRHLLDNAAREGARYAVVSTKHKTTNDVTKHVKDYLANQQHSLNNLTIQVYKGDAKANNVGAWTSAAYGERIVVRVNGTYKPLVPNLELIPSISMTGQAVMRSEAP